MATLAALEIRLACPDHSKLDISCYTFGAPRTGNHAFAHEYNEGVPDTWGIINDQVFVRACLLQPAERGQCCWHSSSASSAT